MAPQTVLTSNQQILLRIIRQAKEICDRFYLTGGTALAEFYLRHRFSEDLDFFAEQEFEPQAIYSFFKSKQRQIGFQKIDYQQSFNRNLFFLYLKQDVLKVEFTFFPFSRIEKPLKKGELMVDSLLDMAVNKLFTIYQKPRSRDFIDLYFICQKTNWTIDKLVKQAKIKFDWHVDPLRLGSQFLQAKTLKDYPRMIKKILPEEWIDFFMEEAKKLGKKVF